MTQIISKLRSYRRLPGKIFLFVMGMLMISSILYGPIIEGFRITDNKEVIDWKRFVVFIGIGLIFILSGVWLNRLASLFLRFGDAVIGYLKKQWN